jgi:hypothetical protein
MRFLFHFKDGENTVNVDHQRIVGLALAAQIMGIAREFVQSATSPAQKEKTIVLIGKSPPI